MASKSKAQQVTARLVVRRVRDQNPNHQIPDAQGELFPAWRYHAVFTDTDLPMLIAEADHRRHAIVEQVIADLKDGPLAVSGIVAIAAVMARSLRAVIENRALWGRAVAMASLP